MSNVELMIEEMKKKMKEKFIELVNEEKEIKLNLEKCSRLLLTCVNMRDRIMKKKILEKELPEVEQLTKETKNKIETLNLHLLEKRDDIDQFLDECRRILDDYLSDNHIFSLQE